MSKRKSPPDLEEIDPRDLRIYRLKITLRDTEPSIWRRLEVYAGMEMDSLATAIDTVFGWSGDHMGEFKIKGRTIGDGDGWRLNDPDRLEPQFKQLAKLLTGRASDKQRREHGMSLFDSISSALKAKKVFAEPTEVGGSTLGDLVPRVRTKFVYTYDFGDDWKHVIEVEQIAPPEPGARYPRCTDGARANPIEDCGGPWGFSDLVGAVGNPGHERFADLEEWGLEKWDPAAFATQQANRELAKVFGLKKKAPR